MAVTTAKEAKETIPVSIGIDSGDRKQLAESLGLALSNTYVLYAKIQGFHWNVRGPLFFSLHKMTEEQYEDLGAAIDELAERIRAIGFLAPHTLARFLAIAEIKEAEGDPDATEMIERLVKDHQTVARSLREAVEEADRVHDVFTADMLTGRIGKHEQFAWMLRSLAGRS